MVVGFYLDLIIRNECILRGYNCCSTFHGNASGGFYNAKTSDGNASRGFYNTKTSHGDASRGFYNTKTSDGDASRGFYNAKTSHGDVKKAKNSIFNHFLKHWYKLGNLISSNGGKCSYP